MKKRGLHIRMVDLSYIPLVDGTADIFSKFRFESRWKARNNLNTPISHRKTLPRELSSK